MTTPKRNILHRLPPPAECLALVIATLELLPFGIAGLRNPSTFAAGFGLPIQSSPKDSSLAADQTDTLPSKPTPDSPLLDSTDETTKKALVAAIAARNIQNGMLLLVFGLVLRDRRGLGVAVLAGLVTTVADSVIVRAYGAREKVVGHYVGVFNCLAVGGSLLYWGRGDRLW